MKSSTRGNLTLMFYRLWNVNHPFIKVPFLWKQNNPEQDMKMKKIM